MLHAIDEVYGLGLSGKDFKLVGAYGAGFGCGITCGAMAGAMAALGVLAIKGQAHQTPDFGPLCAAYVEAFRKAEGAIDCRVLKPRNFVPERRCLKTVHLACDVFEAFVREHGLGGNA